MNSKLRDNNKMIKNSKLGNINPGTWRYPTNLETRTKTCEIKNKKVYQNQQRPRNTPDTTKEKRVKTL